MSERVILKVCCLAVIVSSATLAVRAQAASIAYDGFDYANDGSSAVDGKNGGNGWTSGWAITTLGSGFTVSQDDTSLTTPAFPFAPAGDRALAAGAGTGSNTMRVYRLLPSTFNLGAEGVIYASFLMRKSADATATSNNNLEFQLTAGDGGNGTVRFGATSGNQLFVNDSSSVPAGQEIGAAVLGQTNFVVLKIESHASVNDVFSATVYDPSETVPVTEPGAWDKTKSVSSTAVLDRVRLWVGTVAAGQFDEIRIGDSWESVAVAVPEPTAALLLVVVGCGLTLVSRRRNAAQSQF